MRHGRVLLPIVVVAWGAVACTATVVAPPGAFRALATLTFLLAGPGLALLPFFRVRGVLERALLVVATSIVLEGCVSETFVLAGAWSAGRTLAVVVAATVVAAAAQPLVLARRERVG